MLIIVKELSRNILRVSEKCAVQIVNFIQSVHGINTIPDLVAQNSMNNSKLYVG